MNNDIDILKQIHAELARADHPPLDPILIGFYGKLVDRVPEDGFELLVADKDISEAEEQALRLLNRYGCVIANLEYRTHDGHFYRVNMRGERFLELANSQAKSVVVGMKDSGKRETFETGAVRDTAEGKPRIDLISPFATEKLAEWLTAGAKKYGERNWEKGISLERHLQSLLRHLTKFQQGVEDGEDHLVAVFCNAMFMVHTREMVLRGVLPESLLDMPKYEPMPRHHRNGDEPLEYDTD
jgi:hypothetical protein